MKSRSLFALLFLLLSGSAALRATEPSAPSTVELAKARARFIGYQERLQLTPEQQEQLQPIFAGSFTWLREWKTRLDAATSGGDRRALLREARHHQAETEKQIEPLLTDTQQKTWKKIRAERRAELRTAYENRAKS